METLTNRHNASQRSNNNADSTTTKKHGYNAITTSTIEQADLARQKFAGFNLLTICYTSRLRYPCKMESTYFVLALPSHVSDSKSFHGTAEEFQSASNTWTWKVYF